MTRRRSMQCAVYSTTRDIIELLESDDELPDSYDETPDIPAYLNDNRFANTLAICDDHPIESDVENQKIQEVDSQLKPQIQKYCEKLGRANVVMTSTSNPGTINDRRTVISRGVMTKRDFFLVKSIEKCTTSTTLLWFMNYLDYKALTPQQKGCLIGEI